MHDFTIADHANGKPSDEGESDAKGEDDEGDEGRTGQRGAQGGIEEDAEVLIIATGLIRLVAEGLDADDALEAFIDDDLRFGQVVLGAAGELANAGTEDGDENQNDRDGANHDEGQLDGNAEHNDDAGHQHDGVADDLGDGDDEGLPHWIPHHWRDARPVPRRGVH